MLGTASSNEDARILVVSLMAFSEDKRPSLETNLRRELSRTANAELIFHELGHAATGQAVSRSSQESTLSGLSGLLSSLKALRLVITVGVTAHLSTIDAYGMSWARVPYRPGEVTALPDGLLIANLSSEGGSRLGTFLPLLEKMKPNLGAVIPV